jgi:hypothetical protein
MNVILCTGMMRSASTWSYNVSRLLAILLAEYLKVPFGSNYLNHDELDDFLKRYLKTKTGLAVIKIHFPGQLALELIHNKVIKNVCTIRDPRDCVASRQLFEKESFEDSVKWIKDGLFYIDFFQQTNNTLFIRYEEMIKNPSAQITRICQYFDMDISDDQLQKLDMLTNMRSAQQISESLHNRPRHTLIRDRSHLVDPTTEIHENHIHGGICGRWKTELAKDQINIIINEFEPWLISLGYETETSLKDYNS